MSTRSERLERRNKMKGDPAASPPDLPKNDLENLKIPGENSAASPPNYLKEINDEDSAAEPPNPPNHLNLMIFFITFAVLLIYLLKGGVWDLLYLLRKTQPLFLRLRSLPQTLLDKLLVFSRYLVQTPAVFRKLLQD